MLCEKPIALNAEEAKRMIDACQKAGVHLAKPSCIATILATKRSCPSFGEGGIGEIRTIRGSFTFNNPGDLNNVRFAQTMEAAPYTMSAAIRSAQPG